MCIPQRHDLGVWATGALGVALAEHPFVGICDDAAYAGVGGGEQQTPRRLRQGLFNEDITIRHKGFGVGVDNSTWCVQVNDKCGKTRTQIVRNDAFDAQRRQILREGTEFEAVATLAIAIFVIAPADNLA